MENLEQKKLRVGTTISILEKLYPNAQCALIHKNAFELLIATILSAQCTDVRVNMVTPELFRKYPTAREMAQASQEDVEKIIQSTGFFRSKARSIRETSADIVAKHGGNVPASMDELTELRGVGRKTANVVLGNAFNQNVGVVVDTHVGRLSRLLDFTRKEGPVDVEMDLMKLVPQEQWTMISHWLILHGRQVCHARRPKCEQCPLLPHCPGGQRNMKARAKVKKRLPE